LYFQKISQSVPSIHMWNPKEKLYYHVMHFLCGSCDHRIQKLWMTKAGQILVQCQWVSFMRIKEKLKRLPAKAA
jgi:hypothetical protein